MASTNPRSPSFQNLENVISNQRRNPMSINTSNTGALPNVRGNRLSFVETPVDINQHLNRFAPGFHTSIQESPASASVQSLRFEPYAYGIEIAPESPLSYRMDNSYETNNEKTQPRSPYAETHPEPTQIHPAYFAPIDHSAMSPQFHQQQLQQQPPSSPTYPYNLPYTRPLSQSQQDQYRIHRSSTLKSETDEIKEQGIEGPLRSPTIPTSNSSRAYQQPVFSPGSLAGPNGINPDLHQPGQVAHPNMTFSTTTGEKAKWNHSMCELSGDVGTCLTGVLCPCILDSRTAYRLNRKSAKKDSTDMLGFSNCNTRCTVMSVFGLCGLFCFFPFTLRTRIRHTYKLQGNMGSDLLHSCCCCCCTVIQNEREVAEREDLLRVNAGPAQTQTQYRSGAGQGMVYAPHGGF